MSTFLEQVRTELAGMTGEAAVAHGVLVLPIEPGQVVTAGGRVLGLTSIKPTLDEALTAVYAAAEKVTFQGMHYRRDIGRTPGTQA